MKRVAAGAHLPTSWLFEPAKLPNYRAHYRLDCSFLPSASTKYSFLHLSGLGRTVVRVRPYLQRTGPPISADQVPVPSPQ